MEESLVNIINEMAEYLSIAQMKKLQEVIIKTFAENEANKLLIRATHQTRNILQCFSMLKSWKVVQKELSAIIV